MELIKPDITVEPYITQHLQKYKTPTIDGFLQDQFTPDQWALHNTLRWCNDKDGKPVMVDLEDLAEKMGIEKRDAVKKMRIVFDEGIIMGTIAGKAEQVIRGVTRGRPKTTYLLTIDQASEFAMTGTTEIAKFVRKYFVTNSRCTHMYASIESHYKSFRKSLKIHSEHLVSNNLGKQMVYLTYPHQHQLDDKTITIKLGWTDNVGARDKSLKVEMGDHSFLGCFPCQQAKNLETQVKKHPEFSPSQRDIIIKGIRKTEFYTFSNPNMLDVMVQFLKISVAGQISSDMTVQAQSREKTKQMELELERDTKKMGFELESKKLDYDIRMEELRLERFKLEREDKQLELEILRLKVQTGARIENNITISRSLDSIEYTSSEPPLDATRLQGIEVTTRETVQDANNVLENYVDIDVDIDIDSVRKFWNQCTVRASYNTTVKGMFAGYRIWLQREDVYEDGSSGLTKPLFQKKLASLYDLAKNTHCHWPISTTQTAVLKRKLKPEYVVETDED